MGKTLIISSRALVFFLCALFVSVTVSGQATGETPMPLTRILFILDASQSMNGLWQKQPKITIARNFLNKTLDSLENIPTVELALRVFGHQSPVPPQDCNDTRLEVPFRKGNASAIKHKMRYLNPKGTTPIANSLLLSASDFPPCETCRNIVILITDGIEACDGDPCEVARELQRKGIILRPFIIGIGLDQSLRDTYNCVGQYYNTESEEKFQEVLDVVISHILDQTTAQVNLLDANGYPTETNVAMTFYDQLSGKIKYNFIHTMNNRGNPDTLMLDPLVTYHLVVHTLPKIETENIVLSRGKHNIIALDASQGRLLVVSEGNQYRDLQYLVRKGQNPEILNWQKVGTEEKYLIGKYDLEIPILPKLKVEDIEIKPNHTTRINIPRPGLVNLLVNTSGIGSLFVLRDGAMEWVYNADVNKRAESLLLQPGTYRYVFRPLNSRKSIYTIEKQFVVKPGGSESIRMY